MKKKVILFLHSLVLVFVLSVSFLFGQTAPDDSSNSVRNYLDSLSDIIKKDPASFIRPVDSIIELLTGINDSATLGYAYYLKGNIYNAVEKRNVDAAAIYDTALQIARNINDTNVIIKTFEGKATLFANMEQYDSSEYYYTKAYAMVINTGDSSILYSLLSNWANLKAKHGNIDSAIKMMYRCVDYYKKHKNNRVLVYMYNAVAATFQKMQLYNQSLKYYSLALYYDSITRDANFTAQLLGNIGYLYTDMGKYDSALLFLNRAREMINRDQYNRSYYYTILNLANVYFAKNNYRKALNMYFDLYGSDMIKQNNLLKTATNINIGICYIYLGKYDSSKMFLDKGLSMTYKYKFPEYRINAFYGKYRLDSAMGNWVQAVEYLKKSLSLEDSIVNSKTIKEIENLRIAGELKHEKELNKLLKKENLLTKELVKRRNFLLIVETVLFVLFLFVIVQFYLSNKKIKRLHAQLEAKNKKLSEQKLLLEEQNELKNKFFSIISHDMISPFNTILGLSEMLKNDYNEISENDRVKMIDSLYTVTRNTFSLLSNLLEWSRIQMNKIKPEFAKVDIKQVCKKSYELYKSVAEQKNINLDCSVENGLYANSDEILVSNIINNLLNNAIKFTHQGGKVWLRGKLDGDNVKICVSDNGVGISKEKIDGLFKIGSDVMEPGTDNEKGTGLGLLLCYDYVKLLGGNITVESTPGKGSTFCFTIPAEK